MRSLCRQVDPVKTMLASLKRHFEDRKEGKGQEWVQFWREQGEELPSLLFRLKGLATDLDKQGADQELVAKFITSLERRFAEQTSSQAMAATKEPGGAYTLDEAYEAALRVQSINSRLRIARELVPKVATPTPARWSPRPAAAHAATVAAPTQLGAAGPAVGGGSGACHNCGEMGHYRNGCPHPRRNSSGGRGQGAGGRGSGGRGARACFVCGEVTHLAAQCPKRAAPVVVAAAVSAGGGALGGDISAAQYKAFQDWRAMSQAAVAAQAEDLSGDDDCEWDELEYGLGAVALPLAGQEGPQ